MYLNPVPARDQVCSLSWLLISGQAAGARRKTFNLTSTPGLEQAPVLMQPTCDA